VRDRAKLMLLAADTYGHAEAEYRRLLGDDRGLSPRPASQGQDVAVATSLG